MTRAAVLALAAALAVGGAACDKTRPVEEPTADTVAECSRCHGYPPPAFVAGGTSHTTSTQCSACHPGTVEADHVTIVAGGLHMNGAVEFVGAAHALPFVAGHPAAALADIDSCRACHGSDYGGEAAQSCDACHAGVAASAPDWKTNCTFCHGARTAGVTTAAREAAPPQAVVSGGDQTRTNPKVGAHQAHLTQGSVSSALPCASCHAVPGPAEALTHFAGGGAPGAIAFSAVATKGVTGAAYASGTCNVYCHGSGAEFPNTAITASAAWTSTGVTCTTCHGMPPPSGPDVSGQTAHAFHVTGQGVGCATCHPVPPGQLAAHVNGAKDVVVQPSGGGTQTISGWDCTACHTALGVALGHALPYVAVHASAAIASLASCTACHGADYGGGPAQSCNACHQGFGFGDWQANCTFCHGTRTAGFAGTPVWRPAPPQTVAGTGDQTAASPKVGAHQKHAGNGSTVSAGFACTQCHPPATDLAHVGGSGTAQLAWGTLATDAGTVPASMTSGTCANYCHGVTLQGGPAASPAWTSTAALSCASCHGNPPSSHSAGSTDCNACHSGTVNANGTINVAGGLHVNGQVEATSAHAADWGLPAQHGYTVNRTGLESCKSCHGTTLAGGSGRSCASCHGAGWDTNCTFCHGNPSTGRASPPVDTQGRSVTSTVSVGVHASHVGTTWATPLACTECHAVRTASVITDASHIDGNGIGEVSLGALARTGGAAATYTRTNATTATCSSTYCHGQFTGGTGADPSWTATTQVTCTSCHLNPPNTGRHDKHVNGEGYGCGTCHAGFTSSAVDAAVHVNGVDDVSLVSGTWTASNRTCSSTGCHGSKTW
jgi:predicted CxxxxCH...CXXCH cytochrome family protein